MRCRTRTFRSQGTTSRVSLCRVLGPPSRSVARRIQASAASVFVTVCQRSGESRTQPVQDGRLSCKGKWTLPCCRSHIPSDFAIDHCVDGGTAGTTPSVFRIWTFLPVHPLPFMDTVDISVCVLQRFRSDCCAAAGCLRNIIYECLVWISVPPRELIRN